MFQSSYSNTGEKLSLILWMVEGNFSPFHYRTSRHTNTLTKINNLCTSNMRHIHVNRDAIDKLEETVKTLQKNMELNHKETKKMIKGITEKQDEMKKTFDEEYPSLGQICRLREEVEVF